MSPSSKEWRVRGRATHGLGDVLEGKGHLLSESAEERKEGNEASQFRAFDRSRARTVDGFGCSRDDGDAKEKKEGKVEVSRRLD